MTDLDTKLRSVDRVPEPDLWDRAQQRARTLPRGGEDLPEQRPPTGQRVAAAIVAFAVFGGAVALMAGVFDRDRPVVDETPLPSSVTLTFQAYAYPSAAMSVGDAIQDGQPLSYSWDEDGGTSIVDTALPDLREAIDVPAGARIRVEGNADEVRGWVDNCCDDSMPPPHMYELDLAGVSTMPTEEGTYVLEFTARWPRGAVTFLFPVRVRGAESPTPTQAAFDGWLVSAAVAPQEAGPLRISIGDVTSAPSGDAQTWIQHDFTIENTGTETLRFDDWRTSVFLGPPDRSLLVGDAGCGYAASSETAPVKAGACLANLVETVVEPGEAVTRTISLWKELNGMAALTPGDYSFTRTLRYVVVGQPGSGTEVPVTITYSVAEASSGPVSSITTAPVAWTTYTDDLGWTMDVPAGWQIVPVDIKERITSRGATFAPPGVPVPAGYPTAPSEPGQMLVTVVNQQGGPLVLPIDDSRFPLACSSMTQPGAAQATEFHGDGLAFLFYAIGDDRPSDEQRAIACRMLESIRFEPWSFGEVRNGWTAIDHRGAVTWDWLGEGTTAGVYVLFETPSDGFRLFGPTVACDFDGGPFEGESMTDDAQGNAMLDCPDDTKLAWDSTGQPVPTGPDVPTNPPLEEHPVMRAHDGTLLAELGTTIG